MPIYEYHCDACGADLEKLQKLSDPPLKDCPECGKPALRKLISAAGFRLKGGGWYETDFKSDRQKNLHDSARKQAKKDEKPEKKKGDSKKEKSGKDAAGTSTA